MVNRNRTIVRAPRRRKVWGTAAVVPGAPVTFAGDAGQLIGAVLTDFLESTVTAMSGGLTHMRSVGFIGLGQTSGTSANAGMPLGLGLAWVSRDIALATPGDGQIPQPITTGGREANWLQRKLLTTQSSNAVLQVWAGPDNSAHEHQNLWSFDITQMRKQPSSDARLVLVLQPLSGLATQTYLVHFNIMTMYALP